MRLPSLEDTAPRCDMGDVSRDNEAEVQMVATLAAGPRWLARLGCWCVMGVVRRW